VVFTTDSLPGEEFHGRISFIGPVLDPGTRTVDVRVNVPNKERRLKPGMFVRAKVFSRVAKGGRVIDPELAGKWISPMHPEVVKDEPGACDVCGMPLVPAEELGYVAAVEDEPPLVIPESAPLITGKRAVVYVEVPGEKPAYEGREVVLGPKGQDHYLVIQGLEEGERVVTHGAFKIDSALQIVARPSMMSPEAGAAPAAHVHDHAGADMEME
jgi:membrane fusion protein, copper/silver efflux system